MLAELYALDHQIRAQRLNAACLSSYISPTWPKYPNPLTSSLFQFCWRAVLGWQWNAADCEENIVHSSLFQTAQTKNKQQWWSQSFKTMYISSEAPQTIFSFLFFHLLCVSPSLSAPLCQVLTLSWNVISGLIRILCIIYFPSARERAGEEGSRKHLQNKSLRPSSPGLLRTPPSARPAAGAACRRVIGGDVQPWR